MCFRNISRTFPRHFARVCTTFGRVWATFPRVSETFAKIFANVSQHSRKFRYNSSMRRWKLTTIIPQLSEILWKNPFDDDLTVDWLWFDQFRPWFDREPMMIWLCIDRDLIVIWRIGSNHRQFSIKFSSIFIEKRSDFDGISSDFGQSTVKHHYRQNHRHLRHYYRQNHRHYYRQFHFLPLKNCQNFKGTKQYVI